MADARNVERYCLYYYDRRECPKGSQCTFIHKARFEIEQIATFDGEEFFLGRPRKNQRLCRFYRLGNCRHQENCHYRHDGPTQIKESLQISLRQIYPNSTPSTSQPLDVVGKNKMNNAKKDIEKNAIVISGAPLNSCKKIDEEKTTDNKSKPQGIQGSEADESIRAHQSAKAEMSDDEEGACASPTMSNLNESWVNAPEFVPKYNITRPRSYAEALSPEATAEINANKKLCPYVNKDGICTNMIGCPYLHGEMCDMCERLILHPYNEEQRKKHRQECLKQHEKNMELSFAIARSKEKSCGVCFEVIMEKANGEQRFGILPNCNHCFCLGCIRKWRQARQFENKIIRACPECRVTSDFVCPSMYWVDTKEDKEKLINDYKKALSRKDCKYFKKGEGKCPFGNKCFYLHALPDGRKYDVGPPTRQRRRRNVETDMDVLQVMLWDFLDERDFPWQSLADDLEDLVSFFTDSDESDWSDYEIFFD